MDSMLRATLLKLAVPCAVIAAVLLVSRARGFSRRDDLGLRWPSARLVALWLGVWIVWVIADELVGKAFGAEAPRHWTYPPLFIVLRIAAIGFVGPISEELVMRGLLWFRLARTRLGPVGAILVAAAIWAAFHYHYDPLTIALIFGDGILLGMARWRTRSVYVPIVMHILGNLYSIYQSLS